MSEYFYHSSSNTKANNIMQNIREIEFWQDECLSSILEDKFSDNNKVKDLKGAKLENELLKKKLTTSQENINKLQKEHNEIQQKQEDKLIELSSLQELMTTLEERNRELQEEVNSKYIQKLNLENPISVSQVFINKLDSNGLNYLFMQLYNKVQQQQFMFQAQSMNYFLNQINKKENN